MTSRSLRIVFILSFLLFVLSGSVVQAQQSPVANLNNKTTTQTGDSSCNFNTNGQKYCVLAPIAGFIEDTVQISPQGLTEYLNTVFRFGIALAGLLAVIMIIWGGLEYLSTDAINGKSEGKKKIQEAFQGLALALLSWLILYTINPQILSTNLTIEKIQAKNSVSGGTGNGLQTASTTNGGLTTIPGGGVRLDTSQTLTPVPEGYQITPNRVAIDTDGAGQPPFYDPHWKPGTAYTLEGKPLDATKDYYVVIPEGSNIPLGTKVNVTDNTTGKTLQAIVGDVGPATNGYGEISFALARDLGAWMAPMNNGVNQDNITYTFLTK